MVRAHDKKRISNATLGVILAAVLAVASYLAFTKDLPWGGGTEYRVAFNSAQNLRVNSPVRIAGVNVGTVTNVEPLAPGQSPTTADAVPTEATAQTDGEGDVSGEPESSAGAMVTIEMNDDGLPLKEDATFKLRPRLFLEGNLFLEVKPGSPGAEVADPDEAFSPAQTSNTVQLDQVLTGALQQDAREDLQTFLEEFGIALIDGGGAESFRTLYKTSKGNFKNTSLVSEATLGENPHDLSELIQNLDKVVRGLGRNEKALQDTVTNLRIVTGSFAAESENLEQAVIELPQVLDAADPALANLNAAFPPLRAFSREILPGVRSTPETLDSATPLLQQVRLLSRPQELRGLARDLVPAVPNLAKLARRTPNFLEQGRAISSCFNEVIIPWSLDTVDGGPTYPHPATRPVFKETAYGLAGIAGESRSGDANGQYIRIAGGGGTNTVSVTAASGETFAGVTQFPIQGTMPATDSSLKTPFRPEEPCENQEAPNLSSAPGPGPSNSTAPASALQTPTSGTAKEVVGEATEIMQGLANAAIAKEDGDRQEARTLQKQALKDLKKFYAKADKR